MDIEYFEKNLAEKIRGVSEINAVDLAQLINTCTGNNPYAVSIVNILQKFLLKRTIAHACAHTEYYKNCPEYKEWLEKMSGDLSGKTPDLQGLPVLTRADVVNNFNGFLADDVKLRSVCHTSGTTGTPLSMYKSYEEINFLQAYFQAMFHPVLQQLETQPLTLFFPNFNHGVPVPLPSVGMTFAGGVTDDTLIMDALNTVKKTFSIPGYDAKISILSGLGHHVLFFTNFIMEQGINPAEFGFKGVVVTGGYMAPHWKSFLSEAWNTIVNDRYTLTETIGGAFWNHQTGSFFLDPHIIGEVLDMDTGKPVDEGIGELVLTNLYPFIQMQPLIRYNTGDLVLKKKTDKSPSYHFEFLGKSKNCISAQFKNREWLIFSAKLIDLIAAVPDIRIYDWFSNVRIAHDRTVGSLPVFTLRTTNEKGCLHINLAFELKYSPFCYKDRIETLRSFFTNSLIEVPGTKLKERILSSDVKLNITFTAPGAIKEPIVIKI